MGRASAGQGGSFAHGPVSPVQTAPPQPQPGPGRRGGQPLFFLAPCTCSSPARVSFTARWGWKLAGGQEASVTRQAWESHHAHPAPRGARSACLTPQGNQGLASDKYRTGTRQTTTIMSLVRTLCVLGTTASSTAGSRAACAAAGAPGRPSMRIWTLESKVTISTRAEMPPFRHLPSGAHGSPELRGH